MITGAGCSRYNSATYADEKNGNLVDRCSFRAACLRGLAFARVRKVEGTAIVADSTLLKAEVSLTEETPGQTNAQCKYDARIGMRFLKHCTLVISQAETTMHCDPPSP